MNGLITYDVEQGTSQWLEVRRGVITASRASEARRTDGLTAQQRAYVDAIKAGKSEAEALAAGGYKKSPTAESVTKALNGTQQLEFGEAAHTYAKDLARERCGGKEPEGWQGLAQRVGHEEEEFAAIEYTARTGRLVEKCGFVATPDRKFGMSLDRRVSAANGAIEIKTMVSSSTLWGAMVDGDISAYRDQCVFGLWLLGLEWIDLCLWAPDLTNMVIHRITRDENEIEALEDDMVAFEQLVSQYEAKLRSVLTGERPVDAKEVVRQETPALQSAAQTVVTPSTLPASIF